MKIREFINENKTIIYLLLVVSLVKLITQPLLLAENGDTYSFFRIAISLHDHLLIPIWAKRLPFLPSILALFPKEQYVFVGRIIVNLFFLASIFYFYKLTDLLLERKEKLIQKTQLPHKYLSLIATVIFATNHIIFENSYYILADPIFLAFTLAILYEFYYKQRWWLLTALSVLSFYTRLEGILLIGVIGLYFLLTKKYREMFEYGIFTALLISPYFIRNIFIFGTPTYSGYLEDQAGFNISLDRFYLTIGNLFFGLGGIWLVPLLALLMNREDVRHLRSNYAGIKAEAYNFLTNPLKLLLTLNLILLISWGHFIRLYTIIFTIFIIYTIFFIQKRWETAVNKVFSVKTYLIIFIALALTLFYYYLVEMMNYKDLSYIKYSSVIAVLLTIAILVTTFFKTTIKNFYPLTLLVAFIVIINLSIFTGRFYFTRYKYYTVYQAVEYYNNNLKKNGLAAYTGETAVDYWYLEDYDISQSHYGVDEEPSSWLKHDNYRYIITTDEDGTKYPLESYVKTNPTKFKKIINFKSPFFNGDTSIYEILEY